MSYINSPNMNLPIPTVGTEPGPNYAQDVNSSLTLIDSHDHTPGAGVQITPAGLDINTSLTMQGNFLTSTAGVTLAAQTSTPSNQTVYMAGVDLYFTDGVGNNVRITQSGAVAGTPGSIANLTPPASASYVALSNTFVFQSNTNIAANLDAGALVMRNISPNSTYALTLQPPASLASNYSITLPTLPATTNFLTMANSGVISAVANVDNVTLQFTSNTLAIKAGGVGTTQLASQAVTTAKIANNAVTAAQIANLTITSAQIALNTITTSQISLTANITGSQLSASANIAGSQLATSPNFNGTPQSAGKYLVASSTNAASGLVIIRGQVSSSGTVVSGEGFTATRNSTGNYTLTWTTAFADTPAVVASTDTSASAGAIRTGPSASNCSVLTGNVSSDSQFSFIAIGRR